MTLPGAVTPFTTGQLNPPEKSAKFAVIVGTETVDKSIEYVLFSSARVGISDKQNTVVTSKTNAIMKQIGFFKTDKNFFIVSTFL